MHRCAIAFTLLVTLCACSGPERVEAVFAYFGTDVRVTLYPESERQAANALAAVEKLLADFHRRFHPWRAGELAEINRAIAAGDVVRPSAVMRDLLAQAEELEIASQGLFNPTIGKLVALWGFHTDIFPVRAPPPDAAAIREILEAAPSMQDLALERHVLRSNNPLVRLDLSAIAKGFAVEAALASLSRQGIATALVDAGGDIGSLGKPPGRPWRVGIREPGTYALLAEVALGPSEGAFTSGNYARYVEHEAERYAHILDPRTGFPVDSVVQATVLSNSPTRADAAATALIVAGVERAGELAAALQLPYVMLVTDQGTIHVTKPLLQRLRFSRSEARAVVLL